ncbi:MAG: HD domain-containing protein, partial [Muribaculaceae bacterium]|nr:HD domain-containing protein [Muribaculaceae bacterium]
MARRVSEDDLKRLHQAFELAKKAHAEQKRKTGEPYILHPIAVARIVAEEFRLDTDSVMAAFLHDVVEDTSYRARDIQDNFGEDVAFLVKGLTKSKKKKYEMSKQLDNFKKMIDSVNYDLRTILIKLADRLHNMRTLSSMRPDKQMKIAGETDYFYAPLATRLGLYNVKTELENLSLRFRVPHEYDNLMTLIEEDKKVMKPKLDHFIEEIRKVLQNAGIDALVQYEWREPYSLWRKMKKFGDDFQHLKYRHYTDVIFDVPEGVDEKDMVLRIYSVLTNHFKEKPNGIINYIDSPKENGYQSFHVKLLADFGRWQEVHISSRRMVTNSFLGCVSERQEKGISLWVEKFKKIVKDLSTQEVDSNNFLDSLAASFYNDDIMTFTPKGTPIILPQKATPIDFAYELHTDLGSHAHYAKVNGFLTSIKAPLHRGDIVEIFTDSDQHPTPDWLNHAVTYKARKAIKGYLDRLPKVEYTRCQHCHPIPGQEVIGFQNNKDLLTIHRRDCPIAIKLASQYGDSIKSVDFHSDETLYPITVEIVAIDRSHLLIDLVDQISNNLNLSIGSINTTTTDSISKIILSLGVHSFQEMQKILTHIGLIK